MYYIAFGAASKI